MSDQGFSAEQIDTSRPHPARMYDYYLGGQDNYEVDREAARNVIRIAPEARTGARSNRDFLARAVPVVADQGVRQIIDIGTGIPTSPNTHECARPVAPGTRVVYVDNDPIVATYAGAKLTNEGGTGFVLADIREPEELLAHPVIEELIDFREPVALLLAAVLHFLPDEEDPTGIVEALTARLAPGSCLVLSHVTNDFHTPERIAQIREIYSKATAPVVPRSHSDVLPFFSGFELLAPGLVQTSQWRTGEQIPADQGDIIPVYGGVGVRK